MSLTNTPKGRRNILLTAICLSLIACVTNDPTEIRDPGHEKRALQCAHDETLSCVEKMGKTVSCTCSSRDDLRDILEPNQQ